MVRAHEQVVHARHLGRAGDLYKLLDPDGPLATDAGYLAEQVFDDGSFDSASPLTDELHPERAEEQ